MYEFTIHLYKPHYFKPIESCYIKTHHVFFNDFNIPLKNCTSLENRLFITRTFLNLTFSEHFFAIKETRQNGNVKSPKVKYLETHLFLKNFGTSV